jgi:hypothetical protein
MKTTILFISLFLLLIGNEILISQPQKQTRVVTVKEEINQYFQNYYSGMYKVRDIVDIDFMRGDKKYLYASIQNPYGMLTNSFVFVTKTSEDYQGEVEGNRVGIYKDGSMLWLSEPDLPLEPIRIFAIDDINLDGTVEITTQSGSGAISLDIYSWNGTTGNLISGEDIIGVEFAMVFVDVEGDGIWEIVNLNYPDGSEVWSWNGLEYGKWPNTPIAPPTELYPANNFIPHVNCFITKQGDSFTYSYIVENDALSKQRIELFWVVAEVDEEELSKENPPYWTSSGYANNLEGWGTPVLNNGYQIWPGESKGGFKFITSGLPTIAVYAMQAYNSAPSTDSMSSSEALAIYELNRSENMVWGETVGPREHDDTLNFEGFLDTLLNYNQRSLELGWITNQTTTDKYDSLFTTAKILLEGNHIPWVEYTLQTVLEEVDEDSSGNITSEAYALLRYNTEYLLENLPEVIAPVLTSITPAIALRVFSFGTPPPAITATATGDFFTDSSVVYFNGSAKTTNYVSETELTFQLSGSEVSTPGNYPVWVSNYGSNSDTLYFSVTDTLPQAIVPILECVQDNGDHTFTAFFGYDNSNEEVVYIPVGIKNGFTPGAQNRGQPRIFLKGEHTNVFSVVFDGNNLTWTLYRGSVTANRNSTPCP